MEQKISYDRAIEIATMALHKLMEMDTDVAQRFMQEEADMDKEETSFMGVIIERKAINIEWEDEEKELPSEVDIPWDIFDDDISDYLYYKYDCLMRNYEIEEEGEWI